MSVSETTENTEALVARIALETNIETLRELATSLALMGGSVALVDRTPDYDYSGRKGNTNRLGESAAPGSRWQTPREIVGNMLRRSLSLTPWAPSQAGTVTVLATPIERTVRGAPIDVSANAPLPTHRGYSGNSGGWSE